MTLRRTVTFRRNDAGLIPMGLSQILHIRYPGGAKIGCRAEFHSGSAMLKLQDGNRVAPAAQQGFGQVERELGADLPVAAQQEAVDPDQALAKSGKGNVAVSGLV